MEGQIHDNQVLNYMDEYITADKAAKDVRLYQQQNSIRRFRDTFNQKMRQGVGESRRRKEASNSAIREMFGRLISFAGLSDRWHPCSTRIFFDWRCAFVRGCIVTCLRGCTYACLLHAARSDAGTTLSGVS